MKLIVTALSFLFIALGATAQECEWLSTDKGAGNNDGWAVAVDNDNNVITVGSYASTFITDTDTLKNTKGALGLGMLIKYSPNGTVLWAKQNFIDTAGQFCSVKDVATDGNNNIYAIVSLYGHVDFGNGVTARGIGYTAVVKYSPAGIAQWARVITNTIMDAFVGVNSSNEVVVAFTYSPTANMGGTSVVLTSVGTFYDIGIVKYTVAGTYVASTSFGGPGMEAIYDMDIDGSDNIYIAGGSSDVMTFGTQTLPGAGGLILKADAALNPVNARKIKFNHSSTFEYIATISAKDNGDCVIAGFFTDTVDFGGITSIGDAASSNSYIAYYKSNLVPVWVKKDDPVGLGLSEIHSVTIKNNNIYFSGDLNIDNVRFGATTLNYVGPGNNILIGKMDTLGNFLWTFSSGTPNGASYVRSVAADQMGDAIITGAFVDMVKVFNDSATTPGIAGFYYFAAKITDYTIVRGEVSPGPYCAGDIITIPYTKTGRYNPGNEFIAQLSDSAGNFEGGERELGRTTDTAAGVINANLPMFNVATTNKYRIRIISTNPVVQSFYKKDALRLLIYSKDTANAGPDLTLCMGQPFHLGTTGGSKWRWSPQTFMANPADSTNRSPMIKPTAATMVEYRIIISDSSGCGVTDTDYVKISVRPFIVVTIQGDSTICRGASQQLKAIPMGGDSSRYWYQWREQASNTILSTLPTLTVSPLATRTYRVTVGDSCSEKTYTIPFTVKVDTVLTILPGPDTTVCKGKPATLKVTGSGCTPNRYVYKWYKQGDTVVLGTGNTFTASPLQTTSYAVILRDTGTLLADTAVMKINIDSVFNVSTTKDTTICKGQQLVLQANVFSCDTSQMEYSWDNGLAKGQYKSVSPSTTTVYTVIGTNKFNGLKDTALITVTVRLPLSVTVNADTTICVGESAMLRATTSGGLPSSHKIVWSDGSGWTDTNYTVTVNPASTTTYTAILKDNCTVSPDTAQITVTVRPPLKVNVNADTTICIGETVVLNATTQGGLPAQHAILWTDGSGTWSSTSKTVSVSPITTTTYKAVLTDNCTVKGDSALVKVTVRPPLSVTVSNDTTICQQGTAVLKATPQGGLPSAYKILWKENSGTWTDTNFTTSVKPASTTTYTALLTDNCTTIPDSAEVAVTVLPALQVSITAKDSICSNQIFLLTATLSGGKTTGHSLLWNADGGSWTSAQNPTTDTPKVTTTYIVTLSDNCSPEAKDSITVTVLPVPQADFTITPNQGCPPLEVTFTDISTGQDTLFNSWKIQSVELKGITTYTHTFTQTGSYNVGLSVQNKLGCTNFIEKPGAVTVFEKPKAAFITKPEIIEIDKELHLINQSQGARSYTWDMGDNSVFTQNQLKDTVYSYKDTGNYSISLVAENSKGCKDTATQTMRAHDRMTVMIPNAFTPGNRDNLNNIFEPYISGIKNYILTMYNRWGQVIHESENLGWDGTYEGETVLQGIYMYRLQVQGESGRKETIYGTVNVLK